MFSLNKELFESQISPDLKYIIYENNETTLCIKEIPQKILGKKMERPPVLGLITKTNYRRSNKCVFIRSDFLLIDDEIYDIKTGIILEFGPNFKEYMPTSYLAEEEMFLVREFECTRTYKFHLNSFLIFRLWSFIACIFKEELLDPGLFLDIYDFVKPSYPKRFWYPIPELYKDLVK